MPLIAGEYRQRTQSEILEFLTAELRQEFGEDIDLTDSSAFRTFAEAISEVDASDVEQAIQEVYNAAYVESATGEDLEKVVGLIGLERQPQVHATGTIRFEHGSTPTSDYLIGNGAAVKTASDDGIEYETTESVRLYSHDNFEDGTLDSGYGGNTGNTSVVDGSASADPNPHRGGFALRHDAVADSHIYNTSIQTYIGQTLDFHCYPSAGAVMYQEFGVTSDSDYYRTVIDTDTGEHRIEVVVGGTVQETFVTDSTTIPSGEWLRNEIQWLPQDNGTIISTIYDANDNVVSQIEVNDENRIEEGGWGFGSGDGTATKYWDLVGNRAVLADARHVGGGPSGNIGSGQLNTMPVVPSGVQRVTNPRPMGDPENRLTSLERFAVGEAEESDAELRERAQLSQAEYGSGTVDAILAALPQIDNVQSVTLYENKTNNDNTGSGGLPPKSFEAVVYGGDPQTIAEAIHDERAFTSRDYGGAHGTAVSTQVEAFNGQSFTINFSRPNTVDIDMTLDLVVNDEYIGDDALRDRIVEYIGGIKPDGTAALGLDSGADVVIDQLEDIVVGPRDTGVIGIDPSGSSYTPSTTTDADGLEVIAVGANEVPETNGEDGSITFTKTER